MVPMTVLSVIGCVFPLNVGHLLPALFLFICSSTDTNTSNLGLTHISHNTHTHTPHLSPFSFAYLPSHPINKMMLPAPSTQASLYLPVFNVNLLGASTVTEEKRVLCFFFLVFFFWSAPVLMCTHIHSTTPCSNTTVGNRAHWCSLVFQSCCSVFACKCGNIVWRRGLDDSLFGSCIEMYNRF